MLDLEPLPDIEAGRETLRRDRERHDAALAGSDVRNGIVACWVLLEETAAEVGVTRQPAETATEFVIRFLHTLDVDPRPVGDLAAALPGGAVLHATHCRLTPGHGPSRRWRPSTRDLDRSAAT